jgi:branched-chain amino acid transport system ATP-binding protein
MAAVPGTTGSRLEVREVSVRFGGLAALADVSLELGEGEILGLIGPNGSGKTTLVNVLSGYYELSSGSVLLDGRVVSGTAPHRLARMGICRTFQGGRLFGRLTVEENIEIGAAAAGASRAESRRRAADLMRRFELTAHAGTAASALPYGLERLVVIARALAGSPRFLLLDEPAAGLDEVEGEQLVEVLLSVLPEFGCGMLVIDHDMGFMGALCQRLHVLVEGTTVLSGEAAEVLAHDAVIDAYLGAEARAVLPVR